MSVLKIDSNSTRQEIEDFHNLYVESYPDLCIWNGHKIVDLDEYLKPSKNIDVFTQDIVFIIKSLGFIIYYTHNEDYIMSISFVQIDEPSKCFLTIKYLCGNQKTRNEKIAGKSQGIYLLDYIFNIYIGLVILIEPATPGLVEYYVNYKTPSFSYYENNFNETFNFLVYGNLRTLKENCFRKIFRSINIINKLSSTLQFDSLNDLYSRTNNLSDLKNKLIIKLEHLIKTKQIKPDYYEQILDNIINIKYYDIHDILIASDEFIRNPTITNRSTTESKSLIKSGGKKNRRKTKNNKSKRKRKRKRKLTRKY